MRILSFNLEKDTLTDVWRSFSFYRCIEGERLVVSDGRLFLLLWTLCRRHSEMKTHFLVSVIGPTQSHCSNPYLDYPETLFEVYEVLIVEKSRKLVVQLTKVQLQQIFGSDDPDIDVAYGFPWYGSNGMCSSVALVCKKTGHIRRYYLATKLVDVLPEHPLLQTSEEPPP